MKIIQATLATILFHSQVDMHAFAQPINGETGVGWFENYAGIDEDFLEDYLLRFAFIEGEEKACYNDALKTIPGGPTTTQMIAMFSNNVVDRNGKVYAVFDDDEYEEKSMSGFPGSPYGLSSGLYELIDKEDACVEYRLLMAVTGIGQIVYSGDWAQVSPIEIVGVEKSSGKIFGFYPESGGAWKKKQTKWGDATDGSLSEITNEDGSNSVVGISKNGRRFGLWGDFDNFNYSRTNIYCSSKPAGMGSWTGRWAKYRGAYCPITGSNRLLKYTWFGDKSIKRDVRLMWEPAKIISRIAPESNVFGISTNGNLLTLANCDHTIFSVPIQPLANDIFSVGGLGDVDDDQTVYVLDVHGRLNKVHCDGDCTVGTYNWEDNWKISPHIYIPQEYNLSPSWIKFGNQGGKSYIMVGYWPNVEVPSIWYHVLYELVDDTVVFVQRGQWW